MLWNELSIWTQNKGNQFLSIVKVWGYWRINLFTIHRVTIYFMFRFITLQPKKKLEQQTLARKLWRAWELILHEKEGVFFKRADPSHTTKGPVSWIIESSFLGIIVSLFSILLDCRPDNLKIKRKRRRLLEAGWSFAHGQRARLLKNSSPLPKPNQNGIIFKRADPSHTAKGPVFWISSSWILENIL